MAGLTGLLQPAWASSTPQQQIPPSGVTGFEIYRTPSTASPTMVAWSGPGVCEGEFPRNATIRTVNLSTNPIVTSGTPQLLSDSCEILDAEGANAIQDGTYAYFFSDRILRRKSLGSRAIDPFTTVPMPFTIPILPSDQGASYVEITGSTVYWGRYTSGNGQLTIYRAVPSAGTATFVGFINGAGAPIDKMVKYSFPNVIGNSGGLAILLTNGNLWNFDLNDNSSALVASSVTDFVVHSHYTLFPLSVTSLYAAVGSRTPTPGPGIPAGRILRVNAASNAVSTVYNAPAQNQVQSIAVDPGTSSSGSGHNFYITEAPVNCFQLFCALGNQLTRRSTNNGLGEATLSFETILNTEAGTNLVSDGDFLYYLLDGGVRRLCTDAPPVNFDFAALDLEVTQCAQRLDHSAVIVGGKKGTAVRGYAAVVGDNTGLGPYRPFAVLDASVDGTPLPGSPFYPVNDTEISGENRMSVLRPARDLTFLFELPPLPSGQLTVTLRVNPNQSPAETDNLANNDLSDTVPVLPGFKLCLVAVPMRTGIGTYSMNSWTFPPILERAEALLPVSKLEVKCWQVLTDDHSDILTGDPFWPEGFDSDDLDGDGDCLDAVECLRDTSDWPSGCPLANWHGLIKFDIVNFAGLGNRPGCCSISEMQYNSGSFDLPRGGRTIAHELGHNYGRKHVDCGGPKNPDDNYPYNPCQIGDGSTAGNYGYDPITRTVIAPGMAGDLLSYAGTRWVSDYTWNAIYQTMFVAAGLPVASPQNGPLPDEGPLGPVLFATGWVDLDTRDAGFGRCWVRPDTDWPHDNVEQAFEESAALDDPAAVRVEQLAADRALLSSVPIPVGEPSDPGTPRFTHFVPFHEGARFLRLVQDGESLAEKLISPEAPTIDLDPVDVDLGNGLVRLGWTASDPDGDPLSFMIQYSPDDGANWFAYRIGFRGLGLAMPLGGLPGGAQARFRVTATDGVLTGSDTSGPVDIPREPPMASITGVQPGEAVPHGTTRSLIGMGLDAEDGTEGVTLSWGGTIPASTGNTVPLGELPPGDYQAQLSATDSDLMTDVATLDFTIRPPVIPEASSAPSVDGNCADAAWAESTMFRLFPASGEPRYVRLLHRSNRLYAAFTNLPLDTGPSRLTGEVVLRFDLNGNGVADDADIGAGIDENGRPVFETGDGSAMVDDPTPPYGIQVAMMRGGSAWCAELSIPDSLLGGWDRTVPMMMSADGAGWPEGASTNEPPTWAPTGLRAVLPAEPNTPPVAVAQPSIAFLVLEGPETAVLNGDDSYDLDGDTLSYNWTRVGGPDVTIIDPQSANPTVEFSPPPTVDSVLLELVVNDGTVDSSPKQVEIILVPGETQAPSELGVFRRLDDGFHGRFTGLEIGTLYDLRRSRNLGDDWETIDTITADGFGALNFFDLVEPGVPRCFYRVTPQE